MRYSAIDLFSGAGGITLGLSQAGFDVLACADISSACELTHHRNFPRIPFIREDISSLPPKALAKQVGLRRGELDLLIGGPPCQGFSILGRRDVDDPRNDLFLKFFRVAEELRPKVVVIENVPGLATLDGGAMLETISQKFKRCGYNATCVELISAQYGVPQLRWRMFFIGWRRDLGIHAAGFPAPTHGRRAIGELVPNRTISKEDLAGFLTIHDAISDLPQIESGMEVTRYTGKPQTAFQKEMRKGLRDELYNHYSARLSELNLKRLKCLRPGEDWRSLPRQLLPEGMKRALLKDHTRRYRRMTWDGVARSIITRFRDPKSGEYTHPDQHRTISIREAARIQSFPDYFEFMGSISDQYDQVGNAVPPLLAKAVGLEIIKALRGDKHLNMSIRSRYRLAA